MSNTERATFAGISVIILLGMMFSTSPSILLWLPVIGTATAAITGTCYGAIAMGLLLDKLNIPR